MFIIVWSVGVGKYTYTWDNPFFGKYWKKYEDANEALDHHLRFNSLPHGHWYVILELKEKGNDF